MPDASTKAKDYIEAGMKPFEDISAEERFYNRSVRIRRKILKWLSENVGRAWNTYAEMDAEAANYAGCSMNTAHRWIYQFTRKGRIFEIFEQVDVIVLRERAILE